MEKSDASSQKLLMSYFLQAATSATKESLVLHPLRKAQRPVQLFSSEVTFLQSEHLITAVIPDCACSRRPAATTGVMEMRKTNEPTPLQFIHQAKQSKSASPARCQRRGEGREQKAHLSSWHIIAKKIMHFKMLTVFTQDKKRQGVVFLH